MEEWYCYKCKVKVEKKDIFMKYMEVGRLVEGLKCPKCGAAYITERKVVESVSPGETMLESKF